MRLLPTGALDPSFDNARALATNPANPVDTSYPGLVQLLTNGQLLAATGGRLDELFAYPPYATTLPVGVVLLNADGSRDPGFNPIVQDLGRVNDMVLQPDGKILVGASFLKSMALRPATWPGCYQTAALTPVLRLKQTT